MKFRFGNSASRSHVTQGRLRILLNGVLRSITVITDSLEEMDALREAIREDRRRGKTQGGEALVRPAQMRGAWYHVVSNRFLRLANFRLML
jgi:hypothetical protein